MEEERKRKREKAEQENETEKRKTTAAVWPDGAAGGGAATVVVNEGLPDVLGTVPEFDPDKEVAYTDLQLFTDNFSEEKRIGRTQFGILYRGKIPRGWRGNDEKDVTVKLWETKSLLPSGDPYHVMLEYLLDRMKDEIRFMSLPFLKSHQIVGKVEGYCFDVNNLGVVYDVKPLDTIYRIMSDNDKFGWRKRVKVALGLARLLKLCHGNTPQYIVRNLSAAHVIVDKDFNPILVDFAMIRGGGIGDNRLPLSLDIPLASYGYFDDDIILCGHWIEKTDVYTFGVVLLELIMNYTSLGLKRAIKTKYKTKHNFTLAQFACGAYGKELGKPPDGEMTDKLVHAYLQRDPDYDSDDGSKLTMLALRCVRPEAFLRPTMQEVIEWYNKCLDALNNVERLYQGKDAADIIQSKVLQLLNGK
ncbi:putative serine/threonine-protein kinase PBL26 [Sesamum alatum]|uniref:Serine/threonine-protein kinase PBL26 n=1 Tax=Sesamum alatum TaxID=300844 RepID=A0AAE2CSD2_9LAMI|nr:putative serine/threonine-protein kinase PBL26 [Sesamum alatum]